MKKVIIVLTLMLMSVICSACINNLAIQELNSKAKEYLKAGDAQSAICRLQSSLDLDSNFFETNYNLAIAYIDAQEYAKAKEAIEHAIKINSNFADSYYTYAIILEHLADEVITPPSTKDNEENAPKEEVTAEDIETIVETGEHKLTSEEQNTVVTYYKDAIKNYETYKSLTPDNNGKQEASKAIENLQREVDKYSNTSVTE